MTAPDLVTVTVTVPWTAAYDTLLAVEGFADRVYPERIRRVEPDQQQRYNDLAGIVLPLREAVDNR